MPTWLQIILGIIGGIGSIVAICATVIGIKNRNIYKILKKQITINQNNINQTDDSNINISAIDKTIINHGIYPNQLSEILKKNNENLISLLESQQNSNIREIFNIAISSLGLNIENIKNIDSDWLTYFIDCSKNHSSNQMKNLWAKIIARKEKDKNSFSLKTIDFLRTLDTNIALSFQEVLKFAFNKTLFFSNDKTNKALNMSSVIQLSESGLINITPFLSWNNKVKPNESTQLICGKKIAIFKNTTLFDQDLNISIYKLTNIGEEIAKIIDVEYDEKKFIKNIKSLFQQNKIFEIHIFQINHYLGNEVSYSTTIDFFKSEEI